MREKILINSNWLFSKETSNIDLIGKFPFLPISLPHTWNNLDGQDGGGDFYRGVCCYKKIISITKEDLEKDLYLEFEAVFNISNIFVNGLKAFHHEGGFQTFRVRLNEFVNEGDNEIIVFADNTENKKVYPQFADFTFFGGIYRDVYLIKVERTHFDLDYFGTSGLDVTPKLEDGNWNVYLTPYITNFDKHLVKFDIYDGNKLVGSTETSENKSLTSVQIKKPHLWNGRIDPHLYKVNALLYKDDLLIDEITLNFGLRTFRVDPEKGFFLNDKPYHLHGVSRHQDRLDLGWALSKKEHEEDMELIKEVGATTIRLAHYQHAQYFYDLCDKYGMVVWAEIPYISAHMDTGKENAISQMKELVLQNKHHASIVCWGLSNEITMRGESPRLIEDHKELNTLVHELDPLRLTTIANVSMTSIDSEMCKIPDIISYNHYFGWYAGTVDQNGPWLDNFHSKHPEICLGLSEYGCEAILDWHSEDPKQGDYSEEYQAYYHEEMLKTFASRPYLWSTHVWNMFDFAADQRDEGGKKGRNHKGLVTYDRKIRKDSFYIYKAYWNKEDKFVHICSKRYKERSKETINIVVYTNLDKVTLYHDGEVVDIKDAIDHKVTFEVRLHDGVNKFIASSDGFNDTAEFTKVAEENPKYHYSNGSDSVVNWFEKDGNKIEFNFPEGYLNIDSKISEISSVPLGHALMSLLLKFSLTKMGMGGEGNNDGLIDMISSMSIRRVAALAGSKVITPEILYFINEVLNKIKVDEAPNIIMPKDKTIKFNGEKIIIRTIKGNLNINSKFGAILNTDIGQSLLTGIKQIKKDGKPVFNVNPFVMFCAKQLKLTTILKRIKKFPTSYLADINEVLMQIKHK